MSDVNAMKILAQYGRLLTAKIPRYDSVHPDPESLGADGQMHAAVWNSRSKALAELL